MCSLSFRAFNGLNLSYFCLARNKSLQLIANFVKWLDFQTCILQII